MESLAKSLSFGFCDHTMNPEYFALKIQHTGMSGRAALTYRTFQMLESSLLLKDIMSSPDQWKAHLSRSTESFASRNLLLIELTGLQYPSPSP